LWSPPAKFSARYAPSIGGAIAQNKGIEYILWMPLLGLRWVRGVVVPEGNGPCEMGSLATAAAK